MTLDPVTVASRWADHLPRDFARQLADALRAGPAALHSLKAQAVLPVSTTAVNNAITLTKQGDGPFAGGVLAGRLVALTAEAQITPVWTGPESGRGYGRLTLAVVADLIDEAKIEIMLASYATVPGDTIRRALSAAGARGVQVTLLLERPVDNPNFHGHDDPFPGLHARRLVWPAAARPAGASMHAKVLIVDRRTALVGSANLTGHALEHNLECGLLIRGGRVPASLADHLLAARDVCEL